MFSFFSSSYLNSALLLLQDYTATIFLRQRWTDERLVFEGNKSLSLDGRLVELLWVPDTFIVDSKKSFLHDITVENRLIRIFPNGTVLYALRWEELCGFIYTSVRKQTSTRTVFIDLKLFYHQSSLSIEQVFCFTHVYNMFSLTGRTELHWKDEVRQTVPLPP